MSSSPPVNVRFETPTEAPVDWEKEAELWRELNAKSFRTDNNTAFTGHPGYFPLTIKAAYVIGVVHNICETVTHLLNSPSSKSEFYVPAYGIFASAIDLVGRCLQGNNTHHSRVGKEPDILMGFKWLKEPSFYNFTNVDETNTFITTSKGAYSIAQLISLRHFAAHGQATTKSEHHFTDVDFEILSKMPTLLANGLERYWNALMPHEPEDIGLILCNRLAKANILAFRNSPIYTSWFLFQGDVHGGQTITQIFNKFDWHIEAFPD